MFAGLITLIFLVILAGSLFLIYMDGGESSLTICCIVIALFTIGGIHHFHFAHYTSSTHLPPILWGKDFVRSNIDSSDVELHRSYISNDSEDSNGPGEYDIQKIKNVNNNELKVYTNKHGIFLIIYDGGGLNGAEHVSEKSGTEDNYGQD